MSVDWNSKINKLFIELSSSPSSSSSSSSNNNSITSKLKGGRNSSHSSHGSNNTPNGSSVFANASNTEIIHILSSTILNIKQGCNETGADTPANMYLLQCLMFNYLMSDQQFNEAHECIYETYKNDENKYILRCLIELHLPSTNEAFKTVNPYSDRTKCAEFVDELYAHHCNCADNNNNKSVVAVAEQQQRQRVKATDAKVEQDEEYIDTLFFIANTLNKLQMYGKSLQIGKQCYTKLKQVMHHSNSHHSSHNNSSVHLPSHIANLSTFSYISPMHFPDGKNGNGMEESAQFQMKTKVIALITRNLIDRYEKCSNEKNFEMIQYLIDLIEWKYNQLTDKQLQTAIEEIWDRIEYTLTVFLEETQQIQQQQQQSPTTAAAEKEEHDVASLELSLKLQNKWIEIKDFMNLIPVTIPLSINILNITSNLILNYHEKYEYGIQYFTRLYREYKTYQKMSKSNSHSHHDDPEHHRIYSIFSSFDVLCLHRAKCCQYLLLYLAKKKQRLELNKKQNKNTLKQIENKRKITKQLMSDDIQYINECLSSVAVNVENLQQFKIEFTVEDEHEHAPNADNDDDEEQPPQKETPIILNTANNTANTNNGKNNQKSLGFDDSAKHNNIKNKNKNKNKENNSAIAGNNSMMSVNICDMLNGDNHRRGISNEDEKDFEINDFDYGVNNSGNHNQKPRKVRNISLSSVEGYVKQQEQHAQPPQSHNHNHNNHSESLHSMSNQKYGGIPHNHNQNDKRYVIINRSKSIDEVIAPKHSHHHHNSSDFVKPLHSSHSHHHLNNKHTQSMNTNNMSVSMSVSDNNSIILESMVKKKSEKIHLLNARNEAQRKQIEKLQYESVLADSDSRLEIKKLQKEIGIRDDAILELRLNEQRYFENMDVLKNKLKSFQMHAEKREDKHKHQKKMKQETKGNIVLKHSTPPTMNNVNTHNISNHKGVEKRLLLNQKRNGSGGGVPDHSNNGSTHHQNSNKCCLYVRRCASNVYRGVQCIIILAIVLFVLKLFLANHASVSHYLDL